MVPYVAASASAAVLAFTAAIRRHVTAVKCADPMGGTGRDPAADGVEAFLLSSSFKLRGIVFFFF